MTRVLLVTKLFEPVLGGVETVVGQLAKRIAADQEFSVTILAGNEKPFTGTKTYTWNNATVVKASSFGIKYNTALSFRYPLLLRKLIKEHDVIHFHTPNPLGELSFFMAPIPAGKKVITTVYADVSQTKRKNYSGIFNFFLRRLLKRADRITTMTPQNLDGFPVLHAFKTKCRVVPLAFDEEHIIDISQEEKKSFCHKLGLDQQIPVILFVGRLSEEKGLNYLVDAMNFLDREAQLLIAGEGSLMPVLKNQAAALQGKKIVFAGRVSHKEVACAFSIASVFVLPSVRETFGIVQAEAMRFGLPVINTALGTGVNFVSLHNQTGITVPPADPQSLAGAIQKLLADESLRLKLGEAALKRSELFAPEKMIGHFKEIYTGGN